MKEWFKARNIWGAAFLTLSDAEAGRLAKALWTYTMTGEQQNLSGAEKGIFAMFQLTLGQDEQADTDLSKARSAAGSKGAQAKHANASFARNEEANQATATNKNKNQSKEKEQDNYNDGHSAGAWVSDPEISESLERDRKIEEAAVSWGLPHHEGNMIEARDMAREYSLEWLLRAIQTAGKGKEQTWRYVRGILNSWKQNGGPDAPRKPESKPTKVVSAQQYTQRDYTEAELDSVSADLLAEAQAMRGSA